MQTVIGVPPRADPGIARPRKTIGALSRLWRAVVQPMLRQARRRGKRCLTSFSGGPRPGPACKYTMLVASDIRQDASGTEL